MFPSFDAVQLRVNVPRLELAGCAEAVDCVILDWKTPDSLMIAGLKFEGTVIGLSLVPKLRVICALADVAMPKITMPARNRENGLFFIESFSLE
jgi:hypothetical protein